MFKVLLALLILLAPVFSEAAYKVYLKNGSEIPDVSSYGEAGDDVILYFRTGSMEISRQDILKIEESEASPEESTGGTPETRESQEMQNTGEIEAPMPQSTVDEKSERLNELKGQVDSLNSEIKSTEEKEASLQQSINDKLGGRYIYNRYQVRQLQKEIDPIRQELFTVQEKKKELMQRKSDLENQLKELQ